MSRHLKYAAGAAMIVAAAIATAPAAMAQDASAEQPQRVLEAFDELFNTYSGNYFEDRTFGAQLRLLTGPGGIDSARWPEREIMYDANALHHAQIDLMALQTRQDPTLRVPDLPNPYSMTLQTMPSAQLGGSYVGSEFVYEQY